MNERMWRLLLVIVYLFLVWLMEVPEYKAVGCVMVVLILSMFFSGIRGIIRFLIG